MTRRAPRTFSHNPLWLLLALVLQVSFAYGMILLWRDPGVLSWKGLFVAALFVLATAGLIPLIVRFWRSSWTFTIGEASLVAAHQLTGTRHEIPWPSIIVVEAVPQTFLTWGAARRFNRIAVAGGRELLFAPHLRHYSLFIDELKARATSCQRFAPQIMPSGE